MVKIEDLESSVLREDEARNSHQIPNSIYGEREEVYNQSFQCVRALSTCCDSKIKTKLRHSKTQKACFGP